MEEGTTIKRRQHPKMVSISSAASRRAALLKRQREARRELTDNLRQLVINALGGGGGGEAGGEGEEVNGDDHQHDKMGKEGRNEDQPEMELEQDHQHQQASLSSDDTMRVAMMNISVGDKATTNRHTSHVVEKKPFRRHSISQAAAQRVRYYSSQFSIPEWMVDVPQELNGKGGTEHGRGWFVMARPEGKRCLMIAAQGTTITRLQNGDVLHRFSSALPNGSCHSNGPKDGWTLLDCIYHEADRTYYVLDLLCWRNLELYDCTCEFRLFFLRSKYAEELGPNGATVNNNEKEGFRIMPLLYYDCDLTGLQKAYQDFTPFQRDGLLFMNKQGYYELGLSPLILLWKDRRTSRFFLESQQQTTDVCMMEKYGAPAAPPSPLKCVLSVGLEPLTAEESTGAAAKGDYPISTLEGLVVGGVEETEMERWGLLQARDEKGIEPSILVRFRYTKAVEGGNENDDSIIGKGGGVKMEGLSFEKRCSMSRAMADPWSKILFHSRAREEGEGGGGITIEDVLEIASHQRHDDLAEGNVDMI